MAASFSDKYLLGQDVGFRSRVRAALIGGAVSIVGEAVATPNHYARVRNAVAIVNSPDTFYIKYADAAACDAAIIAAATAGGTVALTAGNAATQGALVTDAQILAALGTLFDAFVVPF